MVEKNERKPFLTRQFHSNRVELIKPLKFNAVARLNAKTLHF